MALDSLASIVSHYIRHHRSRAAAELRYYSDLPSLEEANARASRAENSRGQRHSHQRRLPRSAPPEILPRLNATDLQAATSYADLHRIIEAAIGSVRGVAKLMLYDTALRVGAFLHLEPEHVYLHAGTRDGAQALGIARHRSHLAPDELPAEFRRLRPYEIEDCLCIYKDQLKRLQID